MNDYKATVEKLMAVPEQPQGWPAPLDLQELAQREPEPPAMLIDDWLPAGYATLLAGHGGSGKSALALQLAACMAAGRPWCGLDVKQARVLYLSFEDRESVLHWRLQRICRHLDLDMASLPDLLLLDLVGEPAALWMREELPAGYRHLRRAFEDHRPDVVIVDGIADTFAGNENSRADVKAYVAALLALIDPDKGAILLVGHVAKPTASAGVGEGYSGSTGWHNSVRARWYLYPEASKDDEGNANRTGDLLLELQKSNLGRTEQAIRIRWDDDAQTFTGTPEGGASHFERRERDEGERQGILDALREVTEAGDYCPAAMQGPRTAHHVLSACSSFPESLRGKRESRRFRRHLEHLRRIRAIKEGSIRRKNRTYAATIELEATDGEACTNAHYSSSENACDSGAVHECTNAPYSAGGIRGCAHTHPACSKCQGEGCSWCDVAEDFPA
ncbi:MAG: AAA family ATPase [Gammaproteobacteria bacterium]|nr:AAA family ATPase [Gammaproteobacteria bacterium]